MVSASAVILSGPPLKNSWGATWSKIGFFWLLRSKRGAGECRFLSGLPFYSVASGAVAGFLGDRCGSCDFLGPSMTNNCWP